jgi:hypothetical protein
MHGLGRIAGIQADLIQRHIQHMGRDLAQHRFVAFARIGDRAIDGHTVVFIHFN